ncbi:MAG: hypothetical protein CMJ78_15180 [Planctomycetaceae bacterium]|nr:hypothetical protein [Planctomycetaceae bacterium]
MDAVSKRRRSLKVARFSMLLFALLLVFSASGCSFFFMLGKMFFGDPTIPSEFRSRTRIRLAKQDKPIVVVCTTPEFVQAELPAMAFDLTEGILRRLKRHGIPIVNPDKVATWIDDNGGEVGSPGDLAQDFDASFIVMIDIERFRTMAENSPSMYQGNASGAVLVYQVVDDDLGRRAQSVYSGEFRTTYPPMNPISRESMEKKVFQKRFMDHLADQLARQFHDHRLSDDF